MKKDKPYTLVIIDMQYDYTASDSKTLLKNIKREIRRAKRNESDIIFVTWDGNTIPELVRVAERDDYPHITHVEKNQTDGGQDVIEELSFHKMNHLKVVGVQTSVCVADTVSSLVQLLPNSQIEVIRDCVRDFPEGKGAQSRAWQEVIVRFDKVPKRQLQFRV